MHFHSPSESDSPNDQRILWAWTQKDSSAALSCLYLACGCSAVSILAMASALLVERRRSTAARELSIVKVPPSSWARKVMLSLIGLGPLFTCVSIGRSLENVIAAMVTMHWGAMVLVPSLYCAVQYYLGYGAAMELFYLGLFDGAMKHSLWKCLRGTVLGVSVFWGTCGGFYLASCKTFRWTLCAHSVRRPLEDYGFLDHSVWFQLLAAMYFTFANPAFEEFFWRVFLHRELGLAIGANKQVPAAAVDPDSLLEGGEEAKKPWTSLVQEAIETIPTSAEQLHTGCSVRWGVSILYASYHAWPIMVLFHKTWWAYAPLGFCFLVALGRFFVMLRENPHFGLPAAYATHAWIDAAFAMVCFSDFYPHAISALI